MSFNKPQNFRREFTELLLSNYTCILDSFYLSTYQVLRDTVFMTTCYSSISVSLYSQLKRFAGTCSVILTTMVMQITFISYSEHLLNVFSTFSIYIIFFHYLA